MARMATFELDPLVKDPRTPGPQERGGLGSALLLQNARWFSEVRWIVVGVLALAGMIGRLFPGSLRDLGVSLPFAGLWTLAAVLAAANTVFRLVARGFPEDPGASVKAFLWCQIFVDLVIVTLLVHIIGSTRTFIPFVYLFHVSMACIFFPKKESFLVTLAATILYLLTVLGELAGAWPSEGVLGVPALIPTTGTPPALLAAGSAVFIWWVVWYFVSTLSEAVRRRDLQLSAANQQLLKADQEKNQHMLMTVHELKVPFAGVESTIDILKVQHWDSIPPAVRPILDRIDTQAQLLRGRINEILLFGDLRSRDRPRNLSCQWTSPCSSIRCSRAWNRRRRNVAFSSFSACHRSGPPGISISSLFSSRTSSRMPYRILPRAGAWKSEPVSVRRTFVSSWPTTGSGYGMTLFPTSSRSSTGQRKQRVSTGCPQVWD